MEVFYLIKRPFGVYAKQISFHRPEMKQTFLELLHSRYHRGASQSSLTASMFPHSERFLLFLIKDARRGKETRQEREETRKEDLGKLRAPNKYHVTEPRTVREYSCEGTLVLSLLWFFGTFI